MVVSDWVDWAGKQNNQNGSEYENLMPDLPSGTLVNVKFRDGGISTAAIPFEDWGRNWDDDTHLFYDGDGIIAYRIVTPDA